MEASLYHCYSYRSSSTTGLLATMGTASSSSAAGCSVSVGAVSSAAPTAGLSNSPRGDALDKDKIILKIKPSAASARNSPSVEKQLKVREIQCNVLV